MICLCTCLSFFFFFNDTATTEIYTLSLHDALPISHGFQRFVKLGYISHHQHEITEGDGAGLHLPESHKKYRGRSEEHTSELQSRLHLVCRLLLEKKKTKT